jgi:hypothetical protein
LAQDRVGSGSKVKTAWSSIVTLSVKNPVRKLCFDLMYTPTTSGFVLAQALTDLESHVPLK